MHWLCRIGIHKWVDHVFYRFAKWVDPKNPPPVVIMDGIGMACKRCKKRK